MFALPRVPPVHVVWLVQVGAASSGFRRRRRTRVGGRHPSVGDTASGRHAGVHPRLERARVRRRDGGVRRWRHRRGGRLHACHRPDPVGLRRVSGSRGLERGDRGEGLRRAARGSGPVTAPALRAQDVVRRAGKLGREHDTTVRRRSSIRSSAGGPAVLPRTAPGAAVLAPARCRAGGSAAPPVMVPSQAPSTTTSAAAANRLRVRPELAGRAPARHHPVDLARPASARADELAPSCDCGTPRSSVTAQSRRERSSRRRRAHARTRAARLAPARYSCPPREAHPAATSVCRRRGLESPPGSAGERPAHAANSARRIPGPRLHAPDGAEAASLTATRRFVTEGDEREES